MTDDLVAFLRARLDEDEHVGRAADIGRASGVGPWELWTITNPARGEVHATPARVLREVEAKRQIIDESEAVLTAPVIVRPPPPGMGGNPAALAARLANAVLRLLALPYAAHLDYRAEWAPDR